MTTFVPVSGNSIAIAQDIHVSRTRNPVLVPQDSRAVDLTLISQSNLQSPLLLDGRINHTITPIRLSDSKMLVFLKLMMTHLLYRGTSVIDDAMLGSLARVSKKIYRQSKHVWPYMLHALMKHIRVNNQSESGKHVWSYMLHALMKHIRVSNQSESNLCTHQGLRPIKSIIKAREICAEFHGLLQRPVLRDSLKWNQSSLLVHELATIALENDCMKILKFIIDSKIFNINEYVCSRLGASVLQNVVLRKKNSVKFLRFLNSQSYIDKKMIYKTLNLCDSSAITLLTNPNLDQAHAYKIFSCAVNSRNVGLVALIVAKQVDVNCFCKNENIIKYVFCKFMSDVTDLYKLERRVLGEWTAIVNHGDLVQTAISETFAFRENFYEKILRNEYETTQLNEEHAKELKELDEEYAKTEFCVNYFMGLEAESWRREGECIEFAEKIQCLCEDFQYHNCVDSLCNETYKQKFIPDFVESASKVVADIDILRVLLQSGYNINDNALDLFTLSVDDSTRFMEAIHFGFELVRYWTIYGENFVLDKQDISQPNIQLLLADLLCNEERLDAQGCKEWKKAIIRILIESHAIGLFV